MTCKFCGAQIDDDCVICPVCGKHVGVLKSSLNENESGTETFCKYCGYEIDNDCVVCPHCGKQVGVPKTNIASDLGADTYVEGKNKLAAALLAFFLGTFGIQYFYLGNNVAGILCLIFCATGIPSIIGIIMGIMILIEDDDKFAERVRSYQK